MVGVEGSGTNPVPMQTVHVKVLIAPVPLQWAHRICGVLTSTRPVPPQMQHLEIQDMIPNGSVPVPLQKEQVTSSIPVGSVVGSGISVP
jgi:hypothetical protein